MNVRFVYITIQYNTSFVLSVTFGPNLKSPSVVVGKLITNTKALMLGRTHLRRDPRTKSIKSYEGGWRGERSLRGHTMYKRWPTIKLTTLFVRESLSSMYDSHPRPPADVLLQAFSSRILCREFLVFTLLSSTILSASSVLSTHTLLKLYSVPT